jgi:uncharacterized lipoprotein
MQLPALKTIEAMKNIGAAATQLSMLLYGCAHTPQAVVISPKIDSQAMRSGTSRPVALTVSDERPRQRIGTRTGISVGAEMTVQGDLAQTVRQALSQGLLVSNGPTSDGRELRVEIRNLDYNVVIGMWTNDVNVDFGLKAICIRGGQRPYEKIHRGDISTTSPVVQDSQTNDRRFSEAVSKAVNSMLRDDALRACLMS